MVTNSIIGITSGTDTTSEDEVIVQDACNCIVRHGPAGISDPGTLWHVILRCTLKNREQFVLDPAGAQFRQYAAVVPASQYSASYVKVDSDYLATSKPLGHEEMGYVEKAKYRDDPELVEDLLWVEGKLAEVMNTRIAEWESDNGKTIVSMLKQKQVAFDQDKIALLNAVEATLRGWIQNWNIDGNYVPPAVPRPQPVTAPS